jgi:hypothetical protein
VAEKEPSSPSRSALWPLALLGILAFFWRSKMKTPLAQATNSVHRHDSTKHDTNESCNDAGEGMVNLAHPNGPPAPYQCRYPEKKQKRWYRRWKPYIFLLNIATFIAVVWYACTTRNMWTEMRTQTCIQHEASINAERAWVGLSETPKVEVSPMTQKQFTATITLPLKNFGKGPALNVFSGSQFATHGHVQDTIANTCNLIFPFVGLKPSRPVVSTEDIPKSQWGQVLFPSQPLTAPHDTSGEPSSVLLQEVFVVGCIVYKDQFRNPHWTKFSYSTGAFANQVVRDASSFQHLYISSANNYTDDAQKKQSCPVTQ